MTRLSKSRAALAVFATLMGAALVGAPLAAEEDESAPVTLAKRFPGVEKIKVVNFTGKIDVVVEDGDAEAMVAQGKKPQDIKVKLDDGVLYIIGPKRKRGYNVFKQLDTRKYGDDAFAAFLKDYPSLKLRAPAGADLLLDDAIAITTAGDGLNQFGLYKGYVEAIVGDVGSAEIVIASAGDVSLGKVKGTLDATIKGSGDFDAVSAGKAKLLVSGSGDMDMGAVSGDADINISGSGDINLADIGGGVDISINGSGDVTTGRTGAKKSGGASLSISGSGNIVLSSVSGPTTAKIAGDGDITIDRGEALNLVVSIFGSGDFRFGGRATNLQASVIGDGVVRVAKHDGALKTSGVGGDVYVDGKKVSSKK